MSVAFTKLPGLDRDKLLDVVVPILRAHNVVGVELLWRNDQKGPVLELTVERPDSRTPGAGVTIDVCSDISRDLSAALDVTEVIGAPHYRLEVGSPGLDRKLYSPGDYQRFSGQLVKIKLLAPLAQEGFAGQKVIRGTLFGLTETGEAAVVTERGTINLPLEGISSARLVFEWNPPEAKTARSGKNHPHPTSSGKKTRSSTE